MVGIAFRWRDLITVCRRIRNIRRCGKANFLFGRLDIGWVEGANPAMTQAQSTIADTQPENLDEAEVSRFQALAAQWWDPNGKFRPLHQIGPVRLEFVRDHLKAHFEREQTMRPLEGLRLLDIGCGGGLISEPLTRLGATVTGIDPGDKNIAVARLHASQHGLDIDYRVATAEALEAAGETFDAVVCLEVVEHVPDVGAFLKTCSRLVRPGGMLIVSTINRTAKSFALAIVAAEYVLGWLPRGTHQWERFVTTDELKTYLSAANLTAPVFAGMTYSPFADVWRLSDDTDVNYLAASARPA